MPKTEGKQKEALLLALTLAPKPTTMDLVHEDVHVHLERDGRVMTAGSQPHNWNMACMPMCRLGHAPPFRKLPTLEAVPRLKNERVLAVATDAEQSAVFAIGPTRLWSWGSQQNGTLGNGTGDPVCYEPRVIFDLNDLSPKGAMDEHVETWVQVSAGARCGAALTSRGRLFTWGMAHWGSGHPDVLEQLTPKIPEALVGVHIVHVVCLPNYGNGTLAVDDAGTVWQPKHQAVTRQCPWKPQPLTPTLLGWLGLPPGVASCIL